MYKLETGHDRTDTKNAKIWFYLVVQFPNSSPYNRIKFYRPCSTCTKPFSHVLDSVRSIYRTYRTECGQFTALTALGAAKKFYLQAILLLPREKLDQTAYRLMEGYVLHNLPTVHSNL